MLQVILFNVTNGLIIGAFYVLMALGLSLILNLSNVINFAHGNFLALGGYFAFMLTPVVGILGRLADRAAGNRAARLHCRATDDPSRLQPGSGLQPAADLWSRLHHAGSVSLHLGTQRTATWRAGRHVRTTQSLVPCRRLPSAFSIQGSRLVLVHPDASISRLPRRVAGTFCAGFHCAVVLT